MKKWGTLSLLLSVSIIASFCFVNLVMADDDDYGTEYNKFHLNRALKGDKNLKWTDLEQANLSNADLRNVNFIGADLEEADLQNADLRGANLSRADLEGANLERAKINGAKFSGADLEHAIWIDGRICAEHSIGKCR